MQERVILKNNTTASDAKDTKKVVSIIQNISAQTNLLGLNALIEAARAGDSGRNRSILCGLEYNS